LIWILQNSQKNVYLINLKKKEVLILKTEFCIVAGSSLIVEQIQFQVIEKRSSGVFKNSENPNFNLCMIYKQDERG